MKLLLVAAGLIAALTRADVERAVNFARWPHTDAERARFHSQYVTKFAVPPAHAGPVVESIDVLTPYRRLEKMAEGHEQLHDMWARGGAYSDAETAIAPFTGRVSIVARVYFGLLTVATPDAQVQVPGIEPLSTNMTSIACGDSICGGDYEAVFDAADLGQFVHMIRVLWGGRELARTTADFRVLQ
ncbi:MAG TPA: hypothetical protein VFA59_25895 [Vicinamibacterales bacterium]|nr:hypothetical protein [Vicinamibacterales bacterium]